MLGAAPQLAISTRGVGRPDPRAAIEWVRERGVRGIALDATAPGLRPRELSRSERRGIGSTLRRLELTFVGVDLFIPPAHFTDPAHEQRALDALCGAMALAADLRALSDPSARALVSTAMPEDLGDATARAIIDDADRHDALVADHTPGARARSESLVVGVDPARVLTRGESPAKAAATAHAHRLNDASGGSPVALGSGTGSLEVLAYAGACAVAGASWIVVDLNGLRDPETGAAGAIRAWESGSLPGL